MLNNVGPGLWGKGGLWLVSFIYKYERSTTYPLNEATQCFILINKWCLWAQSTLPTIWVRPLNDWQKMTNELILIDLLEMSHFVGKAFSKIETERLIERETLVHENIFVNHCCCCCRCYCCCCRCRCCCRWREEKCIFWRIIVLWVGQSFCSEINSLLLCTKKCCCKARYLKCQFIETSK